LRSTSRARAGRRRWSRLDDKVRARSVLSVDQERTLLRIADASGRTRVGVGLLYDSPGIAIFDESGATIDKIP